MGGIVVVVSADGLTAEAGEEAAGGARPRRPEWNRFTIEFTDGGSLMLFDTRRLARVRLNPDIGALGPDAEQVTPAEFRRLLLTGTTAVKARLLDQSKISGIGNLLADEALWRAKMSPAVRVDGLRRSDADRLYRALQAVLRPAVDFALLCGAVVLAMGGVGATLNAPAVRAPLLALPLLVILLFHLRGLYRTRLRALVLDGVVPVLSAVSVAAMAVAILGLFANGQVPPQSQWIHLWLFALLAVGLGRVFLAFAQRWARARRTSAWPSAIARWPRCATKCRR